MKGLAEMVEGFVLQVLEEKAQRFGVGNANIGPDFNLLESGMIDSLGFTNLIADIEKRFDVEIDFERFDPAELATLSGLVECVTKSEKAK